MDTGRLPTRILIVPRPRAGVTQPTGHHAYRTIIRAVRRVAPQSTQGVLLRAAREVRAPGWSPATAGHILVAHVDGDLAPLRAARTYLLATTLDRRTVSDANALATINAAIAEIEALRRDTRQGTRQHAQ
jgi:hypothetical protein